MSTTVNGKAKHSTSRSEEVQEIMGRVPSWITRWGITCIALVVLAVFIGAGFFKYPDIIPARVTIFSSDPPVEIIAMNNLPIQQLLVTNNQPVSKGQVLCVLENAANMKDVQQVRNVCYAIDTAFDLRTVVGYFRFRSDLRLGELYSDYFALCQAVQGYQFFLEHNIYARKIAQLAEQKGYQLEMSSALEDKRKGTERQLHMQRDRFLADSILVEELVMSRVEFENAQKELFGQQINSKSSYTEVLQSKLHEKEIQKDMAETSLQMQTEEYKLSQAIRDAVKSFVASYSTWEKAYIMKSPVEGKVSFFRYWKENQFVKAGEKIMVVTPEAQNFIARGEISVKGAGKVKAGQRVIIKLLAYPYEEYGSISGKIANRSAVSLDSIFVVHIKLTNGLATNSTKKIPSQPKLEGMAEIQTENKSILQRLFAQIYSKGD